MSKKIFHLFVLLIALMTSSCTFLDLGEDEKTGEISVRIDGQKYDLVLIQAQLVDLNGAMTLTLQGSTADDPSYYDQINISVFSSTGMTTGSYPLSGSGDVSATITMFIANGLYDQTIYFTEDNIGSITISEFSLEQRTVSGAFEATLQFDSTSGSENQPDEIQLTSGTFESIVF